MPRAVAKKRKLRTKLPLNEVQNGGRGTTMMRDADSDDDEGGPGRGAEAVPEHRGLLCRRHHASGQRVFSRCPLLSTNLAFSPSPSSTNGEMPWLRATVGPKRAFLWRRGAQVTPRGPLWGRRRGEGDGFGQIHCAEPALDARGKQCGGREGEEEGRERGTAVRCRRLLEQQPARRG